MTFDPTVIETPESFVADLAKDSVCSCYTLAKIAGRAQAHAPGWKPSPCLGCRARAIVRGEPVGTLADSIRRRDERLAEIEQKIAEWRARRRT